MSDRRGGRCWFAVDSKSFEISMDVSGERLKGIIVEKSRGFTSWIRFGNLNLCCLLEGVEACCRGELVQRFVKSWDDGGRKFKLESRANEAGRFLLCSVVDSETKRGVFAYYRTGCRDGASEGKAKNSYVDAVKTREKKLREAIWLQLGEKDVLSGREFLDRCLVGRWGQSPVSAPDLSALGSWGRSLWNIRGGVKFARWNPKVGCSQNGEWVKDVRELQWARLLVKSEGLEWPSSLQVVVGYSCYAIQLWWEVQPEVSEVAPMIKNETGKEQEVRDDGGGDSRADFNVEKVQTHGQPAKVAMSCEVGKVAAEKIGKLSSLTLCRRGAEVDVARGSQQTVWEETTNFGPVTQVSLGRLGLSPPALNLTEITDEALMEEASRYTDCYTCSLFSLGKRDFSPSSTPSGRNGVSIATARDSNRGSGSEESREQFWAL
ncbi:hypothetical protein CK203_087044 [Vitis vinifera]|uniref:DUF4283 domain-containing protein n=1 Tax=Vitis vinifera TaxID=29760 RepID=A0A438CLT3_VITVI|nr:hypothetical protein CK203_087044 [Vitis vinifera]